MKQDLKLSNAKFFFFTIWSQFYEWNLATNTEEQAALYVNFKGVDYANDGTSWTRPSSWTGDIHQVEMSDLQQVCAVERVCWIQLGALEHTSQKREV